jgi:hypothetical protein
VQQAIQVRPAEEVVDDRRDVPLQLLRRRQIELQKDLEIPQCIGGLPLDECKQKPVLVAEVVLHQGGVETGVLCDLAQRNIDGAAIAHQTACRVEQALASVEAGRDGGTRDAAGAAPHGSCSSWGATAHI